MTATHAHRWERLRRLGKTRFALALGIFIASLHIASGLFFLSELKPSWILFNFSLWTFIGLRAWKQNEKAYASYREKAPVSG